MPSTEADEGRGSGGGKEKKKEQISGQAWELVSGDCRPVGFENKSTDFGQECIGGGKGGAGRAGEKAWLHIQKDVTLWGGWKSRGNEDGTVSEKRLLLPCTETNRLAPPPSVLPAPLKPSQQKQLPTFHPPPPRSDLLTPHPPPSSPPRPKNPKPQPNKPPSPPSPPLPASSLRPARYPPPSSFPQNRLSPPPYTRLAPAPPTPRPPTLPQKTLLASRHAVHAPPPSPPPIPPPAAQKYSQSLSKPS